MADEVQTPAAEPKHFLASKTYIGLALIILPTILKAFGIEMSAEATAVAPDVLQSLAENVDKLIEVGGTLLVAIARIRDGAPVWFIKKPQ